MRDDISFERSLGFRGWEMHYYNSALRELDGRRGPGAAFRCLSNECWTVFPLLSMQMLAVFLRCEGFCAIFGSVLC